MRRRGESQLANALKGIEEWKRTQPPPPKPRHPNPAISYGGGHPLITIAMVCAFGLFAAVAIWAIASGHHDPGEPSPDYPRYRCQTFYQQQRWEGALWETVTPLTRC